MTVSANTLQLFFTKKLEIADIREINPYPLLNEKGLQSWREKISGVRQSVQVYTIYKPKSKKVLPVDFGDEKGEKPGGREDWYKRAKLRGYPQE